MCVNVFVRDNDRERKGMMEGVNKHVGVRVKFGYWESVLACVTLAFNSFVIDNSNKEDKRQL